MEQLVNMTTKYIVYNPNTGENTYVDTESKARALFLQYVSEFVTPFFHDSPYTCAEIDEAGVETTVPTDITVSDILLNTQ